MKNLLKKYQQLITLLGRLTLGGVLLVAGGLKAFDPAGAANAVAAYRILPTPVAHIVGYALPWLEIAIGLLLIIGISVRWAATTGGIIMFVFVAAIISVWARGMLIDCGCFGAGGVIDPSKVDEVHKTYFIEIIRDLALALCSLYLYFFPYGFLSFEKLAIENKES